MKKILLIGLVCLFVSIIAIGFWLDSDVRKMLNTPLQISETEILEVRPGQSLTSLANELVDFGWIEHPYYLVYEGRRQEIASQLKIGEYIIKPGTTPLQLLEILVAGKVKQYALTIPEGLNFSQILELLEQDSRIIKTLGNLKPASIMTELGYAGYQPEGRIFPSTYHFPANTTDVEFLTRAIELQKKVLQEEWQRRELNLPYASPYQALIMASIIEKETGVAEERGKIAGVFVRRLKLNMKLQTDPTVIYAMGDIYKGNIRKKDLSIDSPYNTYKYKGLPPTPIASAGREALIAALHPEPGESLYFVAKGDGTHHFSKTLQEHNRAVARYQLNRGRQ